MQHKMSSLQHKLSVLGENKYLKVRLSEIVRKYCDLYDRCQYLPRKFNGVYSVVL